MFFNFLTKGQQKFIWWRCKLASKFLFLHISDNEYSSIHQYWSSEGCALSRTVAALKVRPIVVALLMLWLLSAAVVFTEWIELVKTNDFSRASLVCFWYFWVHPVLLHRHKIFCPRSYFKLCFCGSWIAVIKYFGTNKKLWHCEISVVRCLSAGP